MGVIRRHLVQNLHSTVYHLTQRTHNVNNGVYKETAGPSEKLMHLSLGKQQRFVRFVPKEWGVVELKEHKAGGNRHI